MRIRRLLALAAVAGSVVATAPSASASTCVDANRLGAPAAVCYVPWGPNHHCVVAYADVHFQQVCAGCYNPGGWVIYVSIQNNAGYEYVPVASPVACTPR
jgi:hypothetical protein